MYMKRRTNIYLGPQDEQDLGVIRQHFNLDSDAASVRFAIHKLAEEIRGLSSENESKRKPKKKDSS